MSSTFPAAPPSLAPPGRHAAVRASGRTGVVFLAALGPMLTVPAIRRLLMEGHHQAPAGVHLFVAVGMIGSALGAPLLAARADRRGDHARVAVALALTDAVIELVTSSTVPSALVYALRPLHGAASMGLLSLLFAEFRRSRATLVSRAGAAMIAALALGPAVGGALTRLGPAAPFRAAAFVSLIIAALVYGRLRAEPVGPTVATSAPMRTAATSSPRVETRWSTLAAPLVVVMTQRFAIGGLVTAFAIQARVVHHLSDARVGSCFSVLLVAFAGVVFALGRSRSGVALARMLPYGAATFALALVGLSVGPTAVLLPALACAGVGAGLVYAPCLDLVSAASSDRRATSMALLHSAGAVGMILGPLAAAALELVLRGWSAPGRCAAFMTLAGVIHAAFGLALSGRCQAMAASAASTTNKTT